MFHWPENHSFKKWLWNSRKKQNTNSRLSVGDSLARCIEAGQHGLAWSWPLLADGHLEGKLVNGASKPKGSQPSLPPVIRGLLLHLCSTYSMKTFPAGHWIARGMRWVEGLHDPWPCLWWRMWQDVRFNISKCGAKITGTQAAPVLWLWCWLRGGKWVDRSLLSDLSDSLMNNSMIVSQWSCIVSLGV